MALKTCHSLLSNDVDKPESDFLALTLDSYSRENITDFATKVQRIIKEM
jgi:hypothetical protein